MKIRFFALILAMLTLLSACRMKTSDPDNSGTATGGYTSGVVATDGHTDADDNGICDDCGETVLIFIDFYAINDLHGKIADTDSQPGVDELTTYLKKARKNDDHAILLSSGDMWQGSAESNATRGKLMTDWMNELDFASMTLGNHEYDWGEDVIKQNAELAEFPFLAINIYEKATNERVDYCRPSIMVETAGLQIGIIGAIGDCYSSISGNYVQDVYFKTGNELTELVKAESEALRAQGADLIVYSLHDGYGQSKSGTSSIAGNKLASYYDDVLSDGYVDIVFEGHTHRSYVLQDEDGVYHLQNGGDNEGISHAEVQINFANTKVRVKKAEIVTASRYELFADDPLVNTLLEQYEEELADLSRVLGINGVKRQRNDLRQLVADLYLETALERWGTQYQIVLGGGYLSVRDPGYLAAGEVSYDDLYMLFPFDNELVLCSIQGSYLKSQFLETSNSNYFIALSEYGETVADNVDPNATYYLVTDRYSSTYAPNHLTEIELYDSVTFARDLLAAYIEAGGMTEIDADMP